MKNIKKKLNICRKVQLASAYGVTLSMLAAIAVAIAAGEAGGMAASVILFITLIFCGTGISAEFYANSLRSRLRELRAAKKLRQEGTAGRLRITACGRKTA